MILLNTTFCIDPSDDESFRQWVDSVYLPEVQTLDGSNHKFLKIKSDPDQPLTFAIQFTLPDETDAQKWIDTTMQRLILKAYSGRFNLSPERLLHFSTVMEILN